MASLDRLAWAEGLSLVDFGLRIGIRATEPGILEGSLPHLPPGSRVAETPEVESLYSVVVRQQDPTRPFYALYSAQHLLTATSELEAVHRTIAEEVHLHVARGAVGKVFVHAGAVGWKGTGILIPGVSRSGKSTLVAELVKAGATYYSDEYAVLDDQGRVHPYPKPISLRNGDGLASKPVPAEALGGKAGRKPIPVGLVLATRYEEDKRWSPRRLSAGKGALKLLEHAIPARRVPERAMRTLGAVVAQAQVLNGVRGDAKEMVDSVLQRVRAPRAAKRPTSPRMPAPRAGARIRWIEEGG